MKSKKISYFWTTLIELSPRIDTTQLLIDFSRSTVIKSPANSCVHVESRSDWSINECSTPHRQCKPSFTVKRIGNMRVCKENLKTYGNWMFRLLQYEITGTSEVSALSELLRIGNRNRDEIRNVEVLVGLTGIVKKKTSHNERRQTVENEII